jgi:hypothetical protein
MSEPSARCTSIESSGVSRTSLPSIGERKLLGDLAQLGETEHLETAGVGEDRARPVHETMQAAELGDHLMPGPQHQVEGVAQNNLGAETLEFFGGHGLDRAIGTHRHEGRCFDAAVPRLHPTAPCRAVGREQFVTQGHGALEVMNMASP